MDGIEDLSSLIVEKDADVTVWKSGTLPSVVNRGGALKFQDGWRSKAALWLDASAANTLSNAQAQVYAIGKEDKIGADLVYEWLDCRDWCRDYRIRSVRYDSSAPVSGGVFAKSCSDEGGAYMSWWDMNRTRTTMAGPTYKGDSSMAPLAAKCVICVFGSQLGGGRAMFCEATARLARVEDYISKLTSWVPASTPICLDDSVSVRTNGVAVTGSETGFNSEWQIVTLTSETALSLTGIGHASSPNSSDGGHGGQNYREIIVFSEMPSADEIRSVERYLAARWNLPYADAGSPSERTLTVSGSGTVTLDGDAQHGAAGYFTGTLDLNGHRYAIADGKLPIPAEEVPADGRLLWVDPRLEGAVVLSDDEQKPDEVKMIFTRDNAGRLTANGEYCMVSPYAVPETDAEYDYNIADRRIRWTGGWLDFLNGYDETAGNMLAIQKLQKTTMTKFNDGGETIAVGSGFFAIDSSRGGGSLMLTKVSGSAGTPNCLATRGAASPIWVLGKESTVSFDTYLDGTAVDGMTQGFSGRPEVMSFNVRDGASVDHKTTGFSDYTNKKVNNMEIMGEWILYSQPLADADRENVEAYLMKKWLGRNRTGYTDPRDLTVTGDGTLAVATGTLLPKFAAEFTGAVEVTGATWSFTLVQGALKAKEAWECPDRTVTAPAAVTVDLDVSAARQGKFLLASAGTFAEGTTFTLGTVVNPRDRTVALVREGNALYATVEPKGLLLIVK